MFDFPSVNLQNMLALDKYQKPHVFGGKVIYNIYKDLLRVLRY